MKINSMNGKGLRVAGIALVILGMVVADAESATYPDATITAPSPEPTYPAAFKDYNPPVHQNPVPVFAPAISEWTRCNKPGDTMALAAAGSPVTYAVYALGYENTLFTTNWFGEHGAITLPHDLPEDDMYLLWPVVGSVVGAPVAVNQTEAWWLTETTSAGKVFSVFGRNLGSECQVWVEETGEWLEPVSCNPYKADFRVPAGYGNRTYTLWAHNGRGGKYGFAEPLTLTVAVDTDTLWDENPDNWFDVTDYGATGDGNAEDWYTGIEAAIAAASKVDWSTVYFPAGDYRIGARLQFPNDGKIRIVGAGMDQVTIRPHSSFTSTSYSDYLILQNTISDFQLKGVTLEANSYGGEFLIRFSSGVQNVLFDGIRLNQTNAVMSYVHRPGDPEDTMTGDLLMGCYGSKNIHLKNCEFIQKSKISIDYGSSQVFVSNCTFIGTWDANTLFAMENSKEVSVVDSLARNYDDTQSEEDADTYAWCQGRWIHGKGGFRDFYFGGNTTVNMGPRSGYHDPNVGEQVMFEFAKTYFRGSPVSVTANTVTFAEAPTSEVVGEVLVVQKGQGQGQNRLVVAINGNTVTLDSEWLVEPATTSTILIGDYARQVAVYDNEFDGRPRSTEPGYVATIGVMPYGGCVDLVVDNNSFNQLRYAYRVESKHAEYSGRKDYEPNFFNLFMNGTISDCYHAYAVMVERKPDAIWSSPQNLGNVFRNHQITTLAAEPILYHGDYGSRDYVGEQIDMQVFDKNTYSDIPGDMVKYDRIADTEVHNQITIDAAALPPPPTEPPAPILTGIEISGSTSVNEGTSSQYVCRASYSDGTVAFVTPVWSENSGSTTISSSGMLTVSSVSADKVRTITASYGGMTDTFDVTLIDVPPVLTGIAISGPSVVNEESSAQYVCVATYSDGTTQQVTPTWSDNTSHATISATGLLTTGDVDADKARTITAAYGGQTHTYSVTIKFVPPVLTGIAVSGSSQMNEGTTAQYTCMASYSDGTSTSVTPSWSENSSYASVNSSGVLTAGDVSSDQSVTVTASFGGQSDSHSVTIQYIPPVLTGITVFGVSQLNEETTAQYFCTASYSDGTSATVTPSWSENSSYTSISSSGVLSAGDVSSDTGVIVTASFGGRSDTHSVTIKYVPPPVLITDITITGPDTIVENTTAQYVCTATYSDGSSEQVTPVWSENSSKSTISGAGLLTAGNIATDMNVSISASYDGQTDSKTLVVLVEGDQVIFPLSGFAGKTVSAELWDQSAEQWIALGESFEPEELVVENVTPNQWYWLGLSEYDEENEKWILAHGRWIMR